MSELFDKMGEQLLAGNTDDLKSMVVKSLEEGTSPKDILEQGMMPAMARLGERFSEGEAFLPELLLAGDTMTGVLEVLNPAIVRQGGEPKATLLIGTVQGDIHDLGKNIVKMMFEGAGFRVIDLGNNVSAEKFLEACSKEKVDLVGLSSLLTNTMIGMEKIIDTVRAKFPEMRFMVGGAPLTDEFAKKIKADGYAPDAHEAVNVGKAILGI